jgi:sialate O-acetylesterase
MLRKETFFLVVGIFISTVAIGEASLHGLFTDNMVLQRDTSAAVFGFANDGDAVTVAINGQTKMATTANGKWQVDLDPMSAGGPYQMTVTEAGVVTTVNNVMLGDVWVCGGQSNMDYDLSSYLTTSNPDIAQAYQDISTNAANFPGLRIILFGKVGASAPSEDIPASAAFNNMWQQSSTTYANLSSAVGYVYGLRLHEHLGVAIGLIDANKGGSSIEPWMSDASLAEVGKSVSKTYYNGMIAPMMPFAIKGVIWYQGESNALNFVDAVEYRDSFKAMINGWRQEWGQGDFPFLFVQLASYGKKPAQDAYRRRKLWNWSIPACFALSIRGRSLTFTRHTRYP